MRESQPVERTCVRRGNIPCERCADEFVLNLFLVCGDARAAGTRFGAMPRRRAANDPWFWPNDLDPAILTNDVDLAHFQYSHAAQLLLVRWAESACERHTLHVVCSL